MTGRGRNLSLLFHFGEDDNKKRFFQGKAATVEFDLGKVENGLYECQEAFGIATRFSYLKIENGWVVQDWGTLEEMIKEYL